LVSPLTLLTLSAVGLIDNWFNLRARFLSQAKE
jgi:hypothetical protein